MSASANMAFNRKRDAAIDAGRKLKSAEHDYREAVVAFIDEARYQHTTWRGIGEVLGTSDVAARRFYERNRRHVHTVGQMAAARLA